MQNKIVLHTAFLDLPSEEVADTCTQRKEDESSPLPKGWKKGSEGHALGRGFVTTQDLGEGGVWSRRHRWPLCSKRERSVNRPGEMGRSGTHPRAPPPSLQLQIFKLCRLAVIPQSQLLQAVGAQSSPGSHPTSLSLPAAPSPAPADCSAQTSTQHDHTELSSRL